MVFSARLVHLILAVSVSGPCLERPLEVKCVWFGQPVECHVSLSRFANKLETRSNVSIHNDHPVSLSTTNFRRKKISVGRERVKSSSNRLKGITCGICFDPDYHKNSVPPNEVRTPDRIKLILNA